MQYLTTGRWMSIYADNIVACMHLNYIKYLEQFAVHENA